MVGSQTNLNMLREKATRVRVERMLSGDINPHEVALIFADLRFLKNCPGEIRDLPDFAAHRPNKDRGHTLHTTNKLFANLEAHLSWRLARWTASSGYSAAGVVAALKSYLIASGIFQAAEITDTSALTRPIALYGLASMHGCILQRKNGSLATLALRGSEGSLEIGCTAQMPNQPLPQIKVNLCVFSTSVGTDAAIGRLQSSLPHSDPTITVEVTGQGQLRYLE
jgi:hypothetical protein